MAPLSQPRASINSRCAEPVTHGGAAFSRQTLSDFLHTPLTAKPQVSVRQWKPNGFVRIRFWYQNCLMNSERNVTQTLSAALGSYPQLWKRNMNELFVICRANEIEEEQARGFWLAIRTDEGEVKPWPILVARKGSRFFGYENVCPHAGSRLDTVPGQFMDEDGNFLTCGKHRAQFDIDTGHCFIGPCQGKQLTQVELIIDDGDVCVTGVELAEEDGLDIDPG